MHSVDHPDRDLNGYIYLITKLNLAEVTYYLFHIIILERYT